MPNAAIGIDEESHGLPSIYWRGIRGHRTSLVARGLRVVLK